VFYCSDCGLIWAAYVEERKCPTCASPNISDVPDDHPSEYR
jgi:rubrerythrin